MLACPHCKKTILTGQGGIVVSYLSKNPGRYVPRKELVEVVWPNPDQMPEDADRIIYIIIYHLRSRHAIAIESKPYKGYRLAETETIAEGQDHG